MAMELAFALKAVTISEDDEAAEDQILVVVDGKELRCPKKLLVANSKYFKAFISFSDKDKVLELKGGCVDYESLKTILDGLVLGHTYIDEDNVQNILQASAFLQCPSSERASAEFMLANLKLSNAFSIFLLALNCGSGYLAQKVEDFILSKLRSLSFSITSLMDLLHMDLSAIHQAVDVIESNEIAFSAACGWVIYDLDERAEHLDELLKKVITEILVPESLAVDGLEDHPVLEDALAKAVYYEALPLRGKVKYWESVDKQRSLSKWPKLGMVISTGNNASVIAYRCEIF